MRGAAGALHDRAIEPHARVEMLEVERMAVVLGSTQSTDLIDTARAAQLGCDVVRRRSGGGIVLLQPGDHAWIDVTVPRGHHLWDDDVERATHWLGDVWCESLREVVGGDEWSVHRGKLAASAPERAVCFASLGPGEVARGGRKVVGVSQRRTKDAARFQCTVFRAIDIETYAALVREPLPASLSRAVGVAEHLDAVSRVAAAKLSAALE